MISKTKIVTIKKTFIVVAALIIGFLMPYISRIPLAFKYGIPWIWKYMSNPDDVLRWNGLHLISLAAIVLFGAIFIFTELNRQFYGSVIAHFAIVSLAYWNFEETYGRDDFLGCIFFPPFFLIASGIGGVLGLVIELILNRRKKSR